MALSLDHMEVASLETPNYLLPHIDKDDGEASPFSTPTDCPALSESFTCNSAARTDSESSRRQSVASTTTDDSQDWYSTKSSHGASPITPATTMLGVSFAAAYPLKCEDFSPVSMYDFAQYSIANTGLWEDQIPRKASVSDIGNASSLHLMSALVLQSHPTLNQGYNSFPQSMSINPSLSRPIFGIDEMTQPSPMVRDENLVWSNHLSSPLQTIAPAAAFQSILPSSPFDSHEPSTPCKRVTFSTATLSSSPIALASPPIVPSQHDVDELQCGLSDQTLLSDHSGGSSSAGHDSWATMMSPERRRPTMHRRGYERKRQVGASQRPKSAGGKSGIDCAAVIAQNEFACTYPGCIDKSTGKAKRFKRQEHRKRHEKTVHGPGGSHKCWVPGCKTNTFSRTDNLTSHLRNTHGKKSPNQRNLYVATLDTKSKFYDPEWRGNLDSQGRPILRSETETVSSVDC